jgi:hypothetical protein
MLVVELSKQEALDLLEAFAGAALKGDSVAAVVDDLFHTLHAEVYR